MSSTEVSPLKPSVFLHVRDAAHAKATAAKFKRMHARGAGAEDGFATEALSKSKALLKEWQRREVGHSQPPPIAPTLVAFVSPLVSLSLNPKPYSPNPCFSLPSHLHQQPLVLRCAASTRRSPTSPSPISIVF